MSASVTLSAEQCASLRFEVSLGLNAMQQFSTLVGEQLASKVKAPRMDAVTDAYLYVDGVLRRYVGEGLVPYDAVASTMDAVTIRRALGDAATSPAALDVAPTVAGTAGALLEA
jgi:hypothetical protein